MRRTLPRPSDPRDAAATPRQRIVALLGLLLLGFLVAHVHEDHGPDAGGSDAPVVSDDHAHHEHSARAVADTAACLGCRSFDDEAVALLRGALHVPIDPLGRALPRHADAARRTPFSGLPATRAPPIG